MQRRGRRASDSSPDVARSVTGRPSARPREGPPPRPPFPFPCAPMSTDGTAAIDEPLQFDTVARTDAPDVARPAASVRCAACDKLLTETYHSVDGVPSCARCRDAAEQAAAPVREWPLVARAGALGFGAALAGAAV